MMRENEKNKKLRQMKNTIEMIVKTKKGKQYYGKKYENINGRCKNRR